MQVQQEQIDATHVKLSVTADQAVLDKAKQAAVERLGQNVKVPGFRLGKAPAAVLEKQLDASRLQAEVLEQAVNHLYVNAIEHQKLRPVAQPSISITKFVPFTVLEFTAELEVVGQITIPDYTKIKMAFTKPTLNAKDVDEVLASLRSRAAAKTEVKRATKLGDEVTIDFTGTDAQTHEAIAGADGQDYALLLGSNSFIPGFEDQVVGLKAGENKEFTLTFPKDYGAAAMQGRKVTFAVTAKLVKELQEPKLDDAFAAKVGPFKTVAELKADIKKQLLAEKQREADRQHDNQLLEKIATKTEVAIPKSLVDEEINRLEEEEKRNVVYQGQTWQEHLGAEKLTAEEHQEKNRPAAELRVKTGLILGEIAEREQLTVTPEELEIRVQLLKGQYADPSMQAELDKADNRRDVLSRMLTEKTLDKLRSYAVASK